MARDQMTTRIDGVVKSYRTGAGKITALIPDMMDHVLAHRDVDSTITRLLNGLDPADSKTVRSIILLLVANGDDKPLTITHNKESGKYSVTLKKLRDAPLELSDNKLKALRAFGEEGVSFRSPRIMAELDDSEEKEKKPFDLDSRTKALIKKAHKEGASRDAVMLAVAKYLTEEFGEPVVTDADYTVVGDTATLAA